ncbi:serine hydrolase domain-containing protein [Hyphomonas sp.]|jgi:CubicO group peptidase (beta-lactamase class C family)|uniref:serine hydrolase domain-containing protein n=1 Tax=Hyphomonas sp. TaxID=87 RepID=UPI0025C6563D|nr:serine hydrolase domain-containing protein [Hyphomonas sp.]
MPDTALPPISGFVAPGFEAVEEVFAANFARGEEQGAGFAVLLDGEVIIDLHGGWADRGGMKPWDARTLVPVYSTTKGIAALILAMAVEGLPGGYETPVAEVWPEFVAAGKEAITIGEVASHQAGLPGFIDPIDPALWLDPPACAAALAELAPMWPPGTAHGYHPLTWGYLVGEIVARITGRTLGTILREDITAPLGIDFRIGLPATEHDRVAEILRPKALADLGEITPPRRAAFLTKWSAPDRGGAIWREIEIPSANGHGTASAVATLYHAYAHTGLIGGKRLIRPASFAALTSPRTDGPDLVLPMVTRFGAGIMHNNLEAFGPFTDGLGHCGWGGSLAIASPSRGLTCAYVMNRQSNSLVGDPRAVRLVESVAACL